MMNTLLSFLLKLYLNHQLKRYGKMITLNLDPETKTLSISAELKGETSPISASIHYEMEHTENGSFFRPQTLACSREWLELLAQEYLKSQPVRIAIPAGLPTVVTKVLNL